MNPLWTAGNVMEYIELCQSTIPQVVRKNPRSKNH